MSSGASVTERLGLAKVGQGARGAGGAGDRGQRCSLHLARWGRILPSIIHGGEPEWGRGECRTVPSQPDRIETGPARWIPGEQARLGTEALVSGSLEVAGRRGGDRAGPWAAAGEGGRGRAGLARGQTPKGPRGLS